ncbi:MAG: radical SAM protein [Thermodesulfobacteriota bacterium]|nr:radical SAM protein [Thermodesulfobacteriota bacterium]
MKPDRPHILLLNPWIHDFAAYDFWAKPMGLLILAAILRRHGLKVSYIDCLDRFHPNARPRDPSARHGRGPYLKTTISKPSGLENIPRRFSRYGIKPEWLKADLANLPRPDLVLVTSLMTYWYPGVRETIAAVKATFPDSTVVLGGVYATLCRDHAVKTVGADRVIAGPGESQILEVIAAHTGYPAHFQTMDDPDTCLDSLPRPAFDLQRRITYIPLLTAIGCPYHCAYCASHFLNPAFKRRSPQVVVDEIQFWHRRYGVIDFVFYDDALLVDSESHALPIFESIIRSGLKVRLHTPNGMHIREISDQVARLMHRAGMTTLRLGLETSSFQARDQMDRKVNQAEFDQAVHNLKRAGFRRGQIGAYLLVGLPDQSVASVEASIQTVKQNGLTPVLAHYTPIPHTTMWKSACAVSPYDLAADPVFTNNAIFPCRREGFSWEAYSRIKRLVAG